MIILLSSAATPRYREDILRCLSTPYGSQLRYRYNNDIVEPGIINRGVSEEAFVCFIDASRIGADDFTIIPIRSINIQSINTHGSTRSVNFTVGDYLYVKDKLDFTEKVYKNATKDCLPSINAKGQREKGYWLFESKNDFKDEILRDASISLWEMTIRELSKCLPFKNEDYYWVIVKFEDASDNSDNYEKLKRDKFENTPLLHDKEYRLTLYHYQPTEEVYKGSIDASCERRIQLLAGRGIEVISPEELVIDSPYDLKHYIIKIKNDGFSDISSWLRMGPKGNWSVDLFIKIKGRKAQLLIRAIVIALALFSQSLIAIQDISFAKCIGSILLSVIIGIATAFGLRSSV